MVDTSDVPTVEELPTFTLEGEAYGGCARGDMCPSFIIMNDGTFRFLYTPSAGEKQIVREGDLPKELRTGINQTFTDDALIAQSRKIEPAMCNSYIDAIDVRYEVTIGDKIYKLDSCRTDVEVDSALWQTLVKIWNYFETQEVWNVSRLVP